jgi:c-di-GMP-binding flagellar brake protein YcgR
MKLPLRDFADVIAALKGPENRSSGSEKRNAARMNVTAKVSVHLLVDEKVGRSFSALTRDISLTGCGLIQAVALSSEQRVILELPREHTPLFVISLAMHCRPLADGLLAVGFEYVQLLDAHTSDKMIKGQNDQYAHIRDSILS